MIRCLHDHDVLKHTDPSTGFEDAGVYTELINAYIVQRLHGSR